MTFKRCVIDVAYNGHYRVNLIHSWYKIWENQKHTKQFEELKDAIKWATSHPEDGKYILSDEIVFNLVDNNFETVEKVSSDINANTRELSEDFKVLNNKTLELSKNMENNSENVIQELLNEIEQKLKIITGDDNSQLQTKIFKRNQDFNGDSIMTPDLIVYFDASISFSSIHFNIS